MSTQQMYRIAYVWHERPEGKPQIDGEPDLVRWNETPYPWTSRAVRCEIVRSDYGGNWCGYVHVPMDHPWYGVETRDLPDEADNAVHGGITLSTPSGCIGWDAAHLHDTQPYRTDREGFGHYVTAEEAETYTRALARLALAVMPATEETP